MNILFDLTTLQPSPTAKFHGGGYYGEAVFFALIKKTTNVIGIYDSKHFINPNIAESGIKIYDINDISPIEIIKKENIKTFYTTFHRSGKYWQFTVDRYLITWHGVRDMEMPWDIILLHYSHTWKKKIKSILRLIRKKHYINRYINNVIKYKSDLEFITISEHSKASIINFFPHLLNKQINVFYPPLMEADEIGTLPDTIERKKYFLLTSSARWEKNNLRAVWAFDELFTQRNDINFKVVLTGVTHENIFTRKLKNRDKFIFFNYVDRPELSALHKNAYAFIYPSLNEGFGYPPIESMRYGVPVAASGTSAIPEACQNAALYFDPYNVSEIKNRIIQLLNKDIYDEYSVRALERFKVVSDRQKQDLDSIVNFIIS